MRTNVGIGIVLIAAACGGADPQLPGQSTGSTAATQPRIVALDVAAVDAACHAYADEKACVTDPLCMAMPRPAFPCTLDPGSCPPSRTDCRARAGLTTECTCAGSQVCVAGDDAGHNALHCETPIARCSSTDPCACLSAGEPPQCSHSGSVVGLCVCQVP